MAVRIKERPVFRGPIEDLANRLRAEPIFAVAALLSDFDDVSFAEHLQMQRNGLLRHAEVDRELLRVFLTAAEKIQQRAAGRVSE